MWKLLTLFLIVQGYPTLSAVLSMLTLQLHIECRNFFQTQLLVMELPFAILFFPSKDESTYKAEHDPKVKPVVSNKATYFY